MLNDLDNQELDALMQQSEMLHAEIMEIQRAAANVSEKVRELSGSFDRATDNILKNAGKLVPTAYQEYGLATTAKGLGVALAVAGASKAIGATVNFIGGAIAEHKNRKALNIQLIKLQEIAQHKLPIIEDIRPVLEKNLARFEKILEKDCMTILNIENLNHIDKFQYDLNRIGLSVMRSRMNLSVIKFLTREFKDWNNGLVKTRNIRPDFEQVRDVFVSDMLCWCQPAEDSLIICDFVASTPQGLVMILNDEDLASIAVQDPFVLSYVKQISNQRVKHMLLPIKGRREFLNNTMLLTCESYVVRAYERKLLKIYLSCAIALIVLIGITSYCALA